MDEKIVLIGAGSAMFTRGLIVDIIRRKWKCEVALVDTDPEALRVAEGLSRKMIGAANAPIKLSASVDRRDVLRAATLVICTVGVGGRRAWEQDVFIPRKHGIFQPVGDTTMPGGASRALRMIHAMTAIARDVQDLAPSALFFNYGNPMSAVCRGVRKATGADMIGLCHGVHHVAHYLAKVLDVPAEALDYTALGINHLTWFVEAHVRGVDVLPKLREIGRNRTAACKMVNPENGESSDNPFSWKLMTLYGAFPAVLDRHITEFFPQFFAEGKYYGKTLGVDAFSFEKTIEYGDVEFDRMKKEALNAEKLGPEYFEQFGGEHEQVTDIVEHLRNHRRATYSANVPNRGQIPNLPTDAIVECPCVVDSGELKPLMQKPLPPAIAGTLATRFQCIETIVEAALEGSRDKFVQALVLDGSAPSLEAAEALADDLLKAHERYLPQFSRK